jgi:4-hydroxybenzoate polyprenyltransferase
VKLSHTVFALPFAILAAFLAGRHLDGRNRPYPGQLALIFLCMVAARSVAMTFNRIADARFDALNPRTRNRALPAGRLTMAAAWGMWGLAAFTFALGCAGFHFWFNNSWPILLSGPVLVLVCGYSLTKRFTRWSHLYLGFAIAFSPVATWIAVDPASLGITAVLLMLAVAGWIAGFDIIYACQDMEADRESGLYSLPSRLGAAKALWVARGLHVGCVVGLILVGRVGGLGFVYEVGVALAALLLVVENALVRAGNYRRVNVAFFTMNGLVSVVLAIAGIVDILRVPAEGIG